MNIELLHAQKTETKKMKVNGGIGYMNFTQNFFDYNSLNTSLKLNGYSQVENLVPAFGGGGFAVINNFVIGGEGSSLFDLQSVSSNANAGLSGGYGVCNIGYVIYSAKRSVVYPVIGIGGGGYDLKITRTNGSKDFNQQLTTPGGVAKMGSGGGLINAQINYNFFFNSKNREGFMLGFNAGYHYSLGSWKMKMDKTYISNAPNLNMDGFYFSITLGGGSL
jgi:hypothetical protein